MDEAQLLAKYGGIKPKARLIMKVGRLGVALKSRFG
jgi:hypothetical protein